MALLSSHEKTPEQVCVSAGRTAAPLGSAQLIKASCSSNNNRAVNETSSVIKTTQPYTQATEWGRSQRDAYNREQHTTAEPKHNIYMV